MIFWSLFLNSPSHASTPRYRVCLPTPPGRRDIFLDQRHGFFMKNQWCSLKCVQYSKDSGQKMSPKMCGPCVQMQILVAFLWRKCDFEFGYGFIVTGHQIFIAENYSKKSYFPEFWDFSTGYIIIVMNTRYLYYICWGVPPPPRRLTGTSSQL